VKAKVLVVEDEEELAQLAVLYLEREGIDARICLSAEDARAAFREEAFDLVLLDINLPGMDGFEFLQEFRRTSQVPVMIVSAREADEDIIAGLSVGADEFVSKPISPRVLAVRARALLRRSRTAGPAEEPRNTAVFAGFSLDFDACMLKRGAERVPLSAREFDVLGFLVVNAGKTFSPQEIFERIWDKRYGDPTTIGVYVQRIRKKIEQNPKEPKLLETVKGKGYRFDPRAIEKGR
jgi:two-component system response regulator RegX3